MGKGKITISNEQSGSHDEEEPAVLHKHEQKKIKSKLKKEKKRQNRVTALEQIADQEDQQYQQTYEQNE